MPNIRGHAPINPFSTRFVKPGAIDYVFPEGDNIEQVVSRFQAANCRGEILGPHGSGKSTLVAAFMSAIRREGMRPLLIELHDGQRTLPIDLHRSPELNAAASSEGRPVLIVDGYEQLSFWSRFRLKRFCRRRPVGLLITAHRPMGFPRLHRTSATPELAAQIVERLLDKARSEKESPTDPSPVEIPPEEIKTAFARHRGNVRELLFDLYDVFEQRCREPRRR